MNLTRYLLSTLCFVFVFCSLFGQQGSDHLVFKAPANSFTEAIPLGNGRIGAMEFGGPNTDRIILNEKTLWSGGIQDADDDSAHFYLPKIQELLLKGDNKAAQELLQKKFVSKGTGSGMGHGGIDRFGCYQILGDLWIKWTDTSARVTQYSRQLSLDQAVATTVWTRNGVQFKQECFVCLPGNYLMVKISSSKLNQLSLTLNLTRKENASVSNLAGMLLMQGQLPNREQKGMRFAAALKPEIKGGSLRFSRNAIEVKNATELVFYVAAGTDYNVDHPAERLKNPLGGVLKRLEQVALNGYIQEKARHERAFQQYFNRSRFNLSWTNASVQQMSTPERLLAYSKGASDPQLPVLYYNFSKYLLISSAQKGTLPSNLQGIWAAEYQTPWNGDYHLNINLQMNYWLAEPMGLSDLAEPLFEYTARLARQGQKTAKAYYNAPGWVAHVVANPWLFTSPGESAEWGSTLTGGAWLCEHIWEHYRFTHNKRFLAKYYPILKGSAQFLSSILVREPGHGWLVTAPSNSPENAYVKPDGFVGNTAMGPTMDMQICRESFGYVVAAARILGVDTAFADSLSSLRKQLAPLQVGAAGDLNEWLEDWKDAESRHRHVSHLYGLHPYDEITPWDSPDLAAAARKTLEQRGDGGTGWSKAWKINFWARLGDGDHALLLLKQLLKPVGNFAGTNYADGGGTYPNLFCAHPPFQIDGNFGGAAGISEMLVQSQGEDQVIRLLPALPSAREWKSGSVQGFKTRGGFTIDMNWTDGRLLTAKIFSSKAGTCKLLLPAGKSVLDAKGRTIVAKKELGGVVEFEVLRGNYDVR